MNYHDSYVIQIPKIQPKLQSRPEALLTIFEQTNFVDDREITKNYTYQVDDEYIRNIWKSFITRVLILFNGSRLKRNRKPCGPMMPISVK